MRIKMKELFLSCCLSTACASAGPDVSVQNGPGTVEATNQTTLTDGVYSIRQIAETEDEIGELDEDELVVPYTSDDTTTYLLIGKTPDVLFDLKIPATKIPLDNHTFSIHIEFNNTSSRKFSTLTRDLAEIGGHAANVIGGEVVSYHKIREEIPNGKTMVTCCDFSACERLMKALEGLDNHFGG